jgi:hypothetical protein
MVEGNAALALGKFSDLEFPGVEQADQPWNEQNRFALATFFVVQRDMTDIDAGHESLLSISCPSNDTAAMAVIAAVLSDIDINSAC